MASRVLIVDDEAGVRGLAAHHLAAAARVETIRGVGYRFRG